MKTYDELIKLKTREERIKYLQTNSRVGIDTFGFGRYLNQVFYRSKEWMSVRNKVIMRDNGCDLALPGYELESGIIIHHINPITKEQVINRSPEVFDLNNLVCVSLKTHNLIHYGNANKVDESAFVERSKNDTIPWR